MTDQNAKLQDGDGAALASTGIENGFHFELVRLPDQGHLTIVLKVKELTVAQMGDLVAMQEKDVAPSDQLARFAWISDNGGRTWERPSSPELAALPWRIWKQVNAAFQRVNGIEFDEADELGKSPTIGGG